MIPVKVIGMGLGPDDLTENHRFLISAAEVLVGGKRHLGYFHDHPAEKHAITGDVKSLARQIGEIARRKRVVVLASGDPLFYGAGSTFIEVLGRENVEIYPNVTAVAGAFARIREPWQDAGVISFHGKTPVGDLAGLVRSHDTVAVFTDPKNNPAKLSRDLARQGLNDYRICVLEQMGSVDERVAWYDLSEAATRQFTEPNMVVLKKTGQGCEPPENVLRLGMPDSCFAHRQGLITKSEVRVVSLAKLCLESPHVMWDLGAGSGSVSVEAAFFIRTGCIYAVEKNEERLSDIRENIRRFGLTCVSAVKASLPHGLDALPDPDRVFVGGGGKDLGMILNAACDRLKPHGLIVVNTVLLQNVAVAIHTLDSRGFDTDIVQIQVSAGQRMPWDRMLKAQNPVFIIQGKLKSS